MRQEDHGLLSPGMRVRVGPKLLGNKLYGADDPDEYGKFLGHVITVNSVEKLGEWMVNILEDPTMYLYMEEIECIVDDDDIAESEQPIDMLL